MTLRRALAQRWVAIRFFCIAPRVENHARELLELLMSRARSLLRAAVISGEHFHDAYGRVHFESMRADAAVEFWVREITTQMI
jgi:hypothetical protein